MTDFQTQAKRPGSDITISVKSMENPVYVRVGNMIRKVKSVLSPGVAGKRYDGDLTATIHFTDGTSEDATGKDFFVGADGRVYREEECQISKE